MVCIYERVPCQKGANTVMFTCDDSRNERVRRQRNGNVAPKPDLRNK